MMDGWYGFGWAGMVLMGVFWVALVVAIAYGLRGLFEPQHHGPTTYSTTRETPLDELKRRYVRGDISRDEYEHMRRDLED